MSEPYGVFIPAHNAARTLAEAIESVLAQTLAPRSIVVIDDGSTDATGEIAASFPGRVTVIAQDQRGPAAATDAGFAALPESLVAGLDADDLWYPDKAAHQVAQLDADPGLDGVFCRASIFDHGSRPDAASPTQDLWGRSALMIRRRALSRIGPVAGELAGARGEMVDWIARGREAGLRFELAPVTLVARRLIAGSLSDRQDASALLPAVRAALARKRHGDGR